MYYEERLINGEMMYRTSPKGEWEKYSYEKLSKRYSELLKSYEEVRRLIQKNT